MHSEGTSIPTISNSISYGELIFRTFIFVALLFAINAFLWIYTGSGVLVLDAETSSNVRIYSLARQVFILILIIYILRSPGCIALIKSTLPILLVYVYFLISVTWSGYQVDSARAILVFAMQYLIACALCARCSTEYSFDRLISISSALIMLNLVFLIIFPYLAFDAGGFSGVYSGAFRGILSAKNVFGILLSALFIVLVSSLYDRGRLKLTINRVLPIFISLCFAAVSQSMTTIVTMIFCVLGFLFAILLSRMKYYNDRIYTIALFLIISAILISFAIITAGDAAFDLMGRDLTFTGRTTIWQYVINENHRPFFGYGFAGFWQPYVGETGLLLRSGLWDIGQAHNGFVEAYLFGGAVGLSIVVVFWIYLFSRVIWMLVNHPKDRTALFCVLTVIVAFMQNQTESNFPNQMKITGFMLTLVVIYIHRLRVVRSV